jgi:hypothetical protein
MRFRNRLGSLVGVSGRTRNALLLAIVILMVAAPATHAARPAIRGFLPANARPHGLSLVDISTAYNQWLYGSPAETSPALAVRCEQSPIDSKIWFLPVSLGGEYQTICKVPPGSFLVLTPGGWECSSIEPEPFFGSNEAELRECVDAGFAELSYVEVTFNGRTVTNIDDYVVTSRLDTLPPNNLLSSASGLTMDKGYFMVLHPLSRGTHTLRAYDEFGALGFQAGITYTIIVR